MKPAERKQYCKDIQLIFQDPYASLNPRMRIGDIIAEPIITNNILPKDQVEDRVNELLERVGLANYMRNRYPHEFSGASASAWASRAPGREPEAHRVRRAGVGIGRVHPSAGVEPAGRA